MIQIKPVLATTGHNCAYENARDAETHAAIRKGETCTNMDWRNGAWLVARAALSILADVPAKTPDDTWAQFHLVTRDPGALPPGQRKRVAARLSAFVSGYLSGEKVAA